MIIRSENRQPYSALFDESFNARFEFSLTLDKTKLEYEPFLHFGQFRISASAKDKLDIV